jgi:hypothetical protein
MEEAGAPKLKLKYRCKKCGAVTEHKRLFAGKKALLGLSSDIRRMRAGLCKIPTPIYGGICGGLCSPYSLPCLS